MFRIAYTPIHILLTLSVLFAMALVGVVLFGQTRIVEATHVVPLTFHDPVELHGYAWSDTIGWISMNCAEGSATGASICGTNNYKVQIIPDSNPADSILGSIEGYAWSDTIGWIKFGGLSNFPTNTYANAELRLTSGDYYMYGWARACSGTLNGDCTTMTDHPDGWDGWISLKSRNVVAAPVTHYVRIFGSSFNGYAWGSDVVGWVDFGGVFFTSPCTAQTTCNVAYDGTITTNQWCEVEPEVLCATGLTCSPTTSSCELITIDGSLTATPPLVRKTSSSRLTWSVDTPAEVSSCKVEGSNGDTFSGVSGLNVSTAPLTFAETIYTFSCIPAGGGGYIEVASTTIKTLPIISET